MEVKVGSFERFTFDFGPTGRLEQAQHEQAFHMAFATVLKAVIGMFSPTADVEIEGVFRSVKIGDLLANHVLAASRIYELPTSDVVAVIRLDARTSIRLIIVSDPIIFYLLPQGVET